MYQQNPKTMINPPRPPPPPKNASFTKETPILTPGLGWAENCAFRMKKDQSYPPKTPLFDQKAPQVPP